MPKSINHIRKNYNIYSVKLLWHALRNFLVPIDYTRIKEIPTLLDLSNIFNDGRDNLKILDIASPQLLSTTLAKYNKTWKISYLNPFQDELTDIEIRKKILKLENITSIKEDIKNYELSIKAGEFDYIFSCSVFEHIHPEQNGDIEAIQNIKPLLKPGASFYISVPFYLQAFNEYKNSDVYQIKNTSGEKVFFQRFYDSKSLESRIITPSGLQKTGEIYIGERYYHKKNMNKRLGVLFSKGFQSVLFGRLFSIISGIFMETSNNSETLSKPYLAFLKLTRND
jgi:SAM-dependent methyltransferase